MIRKLLFLILLIHFFPAMLYGNTLLHHELYVKIIPEKSYLIAVDTINLPEPERRIPFYINKNLNIKEIIPVASINITETPEAKKVEIVFDSPQRSITIKYEGMIHEPVKTIGEQARGYSYTGGIISGEGVFLHGGSLWYPEIENGPFTFYLIIQLPEGWYGISQGEEIDREGALSWNSPDPQEEIYLIANRFVRYEEQLDGIKAMVFLRTPDEGLAKKYISATFRYIKLYEDLIGPYPYKKFALVENFFESGFGMPSFTLLGPKVLRLPFIIDSSYPHEILHNWWGNSVWPRQGRGNWTEGLTAYLSDHLLKELKGEDREYRFTTLQKYRDYVLDERDFPIEEFRSRHSGATEAVGYGKSLFFFHMLRRKLGDRVFIEGLRDFYRENKFKYADLDDLRGSFERVSGTNLKDFFELWTKKKGAPVIEIKEIKIKEKELRLTLEQTQEDEFYKLEIPVRIFLKGGSIHETLLKMTEKRQTFLERPDGIPVRIDIDPEFHVFRKLSREEIPPAISAVLGSKEVVIIKPSLKDQELSEAWEEAIRTIKNSGPEGIKVIEDDGGTSSDMEKLPEGSLIILGWENRFLNKVFFDQDYIKTRDGKYELSERSIDPEKESFVFVRENPVDRERPLLFIGSKKTSTLRALIRKLPHYHKYSYLVFEGDNAVNTLKGRWELKKNPMSIILDKDERPVASPQNKPLIPVFSKESIKKTLKFLTSADLKGRKAGTDEAIRAAEFIKESFQKAGLLPGYRGEYLQIWNDDKKTFANVIGKIESSSEECLILGAHYDHLGIDDNGKIYPGADDNASGIAILLELARIMAEENAILPGFNKDLIFIAFTGEEDRRLGSRYFVEHAELNKCIAMINLDTVGRLQDKRPFIIGASSAKEWPLILKEASLISGIDLDLVKEELDSSDQKSFEEAGIPAIQIFSGPHEDYHRITDSMDKLDIDGMIEIGNFTKEL
ncbi:MAG: M28 family peptidase, partial [Thermodesulfovibrionales bacterium]